MKHIHRMQKQLSFFQCISVNFNARTRGQSTRDRKVTQNFCNERDLPASG